MRVYLDNCCYNRPFDDQSQPKIALETAAKLLVQAQMRSGTIEYAWSDELDGEVKDSPFQDKRNRILPWRDAAAVRIAITSEIVRRGREFMLLGVKTADALHLACAEAADCDWFLTVDRGILKKIQNVGTMRVANPLTYIQEEMQ